MVVNNGNTFGDKQELEISEVALCNCKQDTVSKQFCQRKTADWCCVPPGVLRVIVTR
jgi:hypothetical protein